MINSTSRAVWFTGPRAVEILESSDTARTTFLVDGLVKIRSLYSGISAGTEMLFYQGKVPAGLALETGEKEASGGSQDSEKSGKRATTTTNYPVKYGYCNVGRVAEVGPGCHKLKKHDLVFSFHPHETEFVTSEESCLLLPQNLDPKAAVLLANVETAIGISHDSQVKLGESVAVFGLGVVGLLITYLFKRNSGASSVIAIDPIGSRRKIAKQLGADLALAPEELDKGVGLANIVETTDGRPDLLVEVSGSPKALQQAVDFAGFESRIVVGSWYGDKEVSLNLGRTFHRNRNLIMSSQVSHLNPTLLGRWDKKRRLDLAVRYLTEIPASEFISDVFPFDKAAEAYEKISERPQETLQVILEYPGEKNLP